MIEPGWYEGELTAAAGPPLRVRVDARGDGSTDPSDGKPLTIRNYQTGDGRTVDAAALRFRKLEHGDEIWPGQVLARVHADDLELRLQRLSGKIRDLEARGQTVQGLRTERAEVERQLGMASFGPRRLHALWVVLKRHVEPGAAVKPGDAVALVAPLDPKTRQPLDPLVYLDVERSAPGRVDGGPGGAPLPDDVQPPAARPRRGDRRVRRAAGEAAGGERRFRAVVAVTTAPFPLRSGAGCKAEIVVGPQAGLSDYPGTMSPGSTTAYSFPVAHALGGSCTNGLRLEIVPGDRHGIRQQR